MNFDQFWNKNQNPQPNEVFTFWRIGGFATFVSTRVWQIIVLNYENFFQKNWKFWILTHINCFYERIPPKILHTLDNLNHNLYFFWSNFFSKNVNFQKIIFLFFHFFSVTFFFGWWNSWIHKYRKDFSRVWKHISWWWKFQIL